MKLSKRLQAIYDLIDEDSIVADVGCDHALLSCALVLNHRCRKVYACDIAEEPLEQAKKTIQNYNVEEYVFPILSDGLENVPEDANILVIAGLGFETIRTIFNAQKKKLKQFKKIIVQSNKDVEKLRMYISEHEFHIIDEVCILDTHYYQAIVFNTDKDTSLSNTEILFGRNMRKDNVFLQMWLAKMKKYEGIQSGLEKDSERYRELATLIQTISKEIEG